MAAPWASSFLVGGWKQWRYSQSTSFDFPFTCLLPPLCMSVWGWVDGYVAWSVAEQVFCFGFPSLFFLFVCLCWFPWLPLRQLRWAGKVIVRPPFFLLHSCCHPCHFRVGGHDRYGCPLLHLAGPVCLSKPGLADYTNTQEYQRFPSWAPTKARQRKWKKSALKIK